MRASAYSLWRSWVELQGVPVKWRGFGSRMRYRSTEPRGGNLLPRPRTGYGWAAKSASPPRITSISIWARVAASDKVAHSLASWVSYRYRSSSAS